MYSLKVCKYSKLFHLQFEHDFEKYGIKFGHNDTNKCLVQKII